MNSATGTAVDNAGNLGTTTVGGIKVDTVAPSVTIGGVRDGAVYTVVRFPPPPPWASDGTSGLASPATGTKTGGTANGVGTFTYTATATDRAGNVGHGQGDLHGGLRLRDDAVPAAGERHRPPDGCRDQRVQRRSDHPDEVPAEERRGPGHPGRHRAQVADPGQGQCHGGSRQRVGLHGGGDGRRQYAWDGTQYQYNWKTEKTQAGSYWRVGVALDDGQTYYVNIALR